MGIRRIHYISGLILTLFVVMHLFNHSVSLMGADKHIEVMAYLRRFYRNIFAETILLLAVASQVYTGIQQVKVKKETHKTFFENVQVWTGVYLALFLVIHLTAVFAGRYILHLDTNFYFGVAGLNSFPTNLFFIPYYALAIISFFGHISAIHNKKMKGNIFGLSPLTQSKLIVAIGILFTIVIFYGLTNHFKGVEIPKAYSILIGK